MDKNRLSEEIRFAAEQLKKLSDTVQAFLDTMPDSTIPWHAAAGAKYAADLWVGFENLCKRRYIYLRVFRRICG